MDRISVIKPKYVWLTVGTGKWTNEKAAKILAKRDARIDKFTIINVARLLNSDFGMVDEVEFTQKSSNSKYVYMYGTVMQAPKDEHLYGDISAISTEDWCDIIYSTNSGTKKSTPPSQRELMINFEAERGGISPQPLTLSTDIEEVDPNYYYYMILAAMIIGEPQ